MAAKQRLPPGAICGGRESAVSSSRRQGLFDRLRTDSEYGVSARRAQELPRRYARPRSKVFPWQQPTGRATAAAGSEEAVSAGPVGVAAAGEFRRAGPGAAGSAEAVAAAPTSRPADSADD